MSLFFNLNTTILIFLFSLNNLQFMIFKLKPAVFLILLFMSCQSGKLTVVGSIDSDLKEASAAEIVNHTNIVWTIEDAGNKNNVYGMDYKGNIVRDIDVSNVKNEDWEDLTSDDDGNLYIGDFGNNNRKRNHFFIYKIEDINSVKTKATADTIHFTLPKNVKSEDFESFFLLNNNFYIFTKETKNFKVLKVPNTPGTHVAKLVTEYNLEGKHNKITSADISDDGKTVVLLNHDKLWKLTDFEDDNFFEGKVEAVDFKHDSQKEGICFKDNNTVIITDEDSGKEDNNIYALKL